MEQLITQFWFVGGGVALAGAIFATRWATKSIADSVVDAIGDTLSERWRRDMDKALHPIREELTANGGSSLKDKLIDVDARLGEIEKQLEGEILFRPDHRFYDEGDAGHI